MEDFIAIKIQDVEGEYYMGNIIFLGLISFFMDISSEMVYLQR